MRTVEQWFGEYAESHEHRHNKLLHWLCVPVIVFAVIGLLWALPVPAALRSVSPFANWGLVTVLAGLLWYLAVSPRLALGMVPILLALIALLLWLDTLATPLWQICAVLFVVAWVGQFIGHAIEGRRPSFFKDVQFLLVGPLWLLGFVYRRFGWRY
jgi:uncharacterized membrane protein YGL010W